MRAVEAEARALGAAVAFLTRLPLGRRLELDGDDVARAGALFPLAGAAVGAAVGGVAAALAGAMTPLLAASLAVGIGVLLTGALHLDGLGDAADALAGRTRREALEIMRDPRLGSYGTVAIVLDLLVKVAALAALAAHGRVLAAAVVAGCVSRASPVVLAALLPYARAGGGAGASLTTASPRRAAFAVAVAAAVVVVCARGDGVVLAGVALAVTAVLGFGWQRRLGGVTGDTLGAAVELTELAVLVTAVALFSGR
jgi:adenosylcobinamide-GDP ribazoletransferase